MKQLKVQIISAGILLLLVLMPFTSNAQVPGQISFQGYLTDKMNIPVDGEHEMVFSLYTVPTGEDPFWNDTLTVDIVNGIYNVVLGRTGNLLSSDDFDGDIYLGVTVGTDGEMTPRQKITSTAFALKAADADTLEGHISDEFADASHIHDFADLNGVVGDGQVPDDITITSALEADFAFNADRLDNMDSTSFAATVHGHTFTQIAGQTSDAQIPDNITINHAASSGNADTVDGQHASAFMLSGADSWVNENGDTMSGRLEVETTMIGTGWGESIKGAFNSPTTGAGVFGLASGSDAHGVHGGATGARGRGVFGEVTGYNGVAVQGNASGYAGIGIYGVGSMYSGFFDNLVKIGPSALWNTGEERGIYFGDSNYVFIGERDGDDILTFKANSFRFENGDIRVEGNTDWNTLGHEAVVDLGKISGHFYIKAVYGDGLKLGAYGTNAHDGIVLKQLTGNVGIGTATPTSKLDVNGTIKCTSLTETSDERFKTNVTQISGALDKIQQIRGVTFEWNEKSGLTNTDEKQIGVVAQEVEKIFPELVNTGKDGYKSVEYTKLTAVLIEAVKEQQTIIEKLETNRKIEINLLKNQINQLQIMVKNVMAQNLDQNKEKVLLSME